MKAFAIAIMLAALYLLYRIAFPKQAGTAKGDAIPEKPAKDFPDVMGKSRFVLPDRSQPVQAPAGKPETKKREEKAHTFAPKIEKQQDEISDEDFNPEDLDIAPDDENDDGIDWDREEAEAIREMVGDDMLPSSGISFEALEDAVNAVQEQPETVSEKIAGTIASLENTDMFEMLFSSDEGKANWSRAIIERHLQNTMSQTETETFTNTDYGDFEATDYFD